MKKLSIILLSLGVTLAATAQPKIGGTYRGGNIRGGGAVGKPNVTVVTPYPPMFRPYGLGFGFGYNSFYSPFYGPFNYPYYNYRTQPTKLDLRIEDIKGDYEYQISNLKNDKSLTRKEKRQKANDLKIERDKAINEAKKNYYETKAYKKDENW